MDDQNRILAGLILKCKPEDLKGVALKADGSLAVVAPNGMKFVFSPVELDNARDSFCLPVFPLVEPVEVSAGVETSGHGTPNPSTSTGSVTGLSSVSSPGSVIETPLASTSSANGLVPSAASIPARQKSPCGTGADSATESTRRRRKEKHL